jgi:hypothetical protein
MQTDSLSDTSSSRQFLFLVISYLQREVKGIAPVYHACITRDNLILLACKGSGQGEMDDLAHATPRGGPGR